MYEEKYAPLPQPHEISSREKEDAMGAYLMMFAALGVGLPLPMINLLAAVIYYFANRKKSRFVHFHALQSLVSQLPTTVLNAIAVIWTFSFIFGEGNEINIPDADTVLPNFYMGYIIMVLVVNLFYLIFSIVGASRAYHGRFYYFLFFGRISFQYVYSLKNKMYEPKDAPMNLPPR